MKALILIQDELINKLDPSSQSESVEGKAKKPEDRMIVLCIAYHNIAVEQEFLKQVFLFKYWLSLVSSFIE